MRVEGERSFAAPREVVWEVLNDPAKMADLMPGVQSFTVHDESNWTAKIKVPLGLGGLAMTMDFEQVEMRAPEYSCLSAHGTGVGAIVNMQTSFTLEPHEDGARMHWSADVKILGPVGAMGQRVLQPIVRQQVDLVLTALDERVAAAGTGAPAESPADAGERPAGPA
jgi:carbon monoxide dehydrogenase subunit G